MSDGLDTVTGECEARTAKGTRCLRLATHYSPVLAVCPKRKLELCSTHFWMLLRADRQEGAGHAQSLAASWATDPPAWPVAS